MTAPARMTPERFAELSDRITSDLWRGDRTHRELLHALAAERSHAQQAEVLHSSAAVLGYLLLVKGEDTVFTVGASPFDEPFPTVEAAQDEAATFRNVTAVVIAAVRVGADGRIGS